jgi:c-di-GMP-binding flagellar brake protein YcgR
VTQVSEEKKTPAPGSAPFDAAKPEETLPLLQSAIPHKAKLQCWSAGQKHTYTSRIVKVHESAGLKSVSVSKEAAGGEEFEAALLREAAEEIMFSLHLPTDIVFFKGELRRGESGTFTARVKEPIYKVQRRQSLRLPVPTAQKVPVRFRLASRADAFYEAQVLNVSDGGISMMSGDDEVFRACAKDAKLANMVFQIGPIDVGASGIVRHAMELKAPGVKEKYRFGIEFTAIDPKIKDRLSRYVMEESAKFTGRI